MIEKWKAERGFPRIERVECTRETKASIWYMARKLRIDTSDQTTEVKAAKETETVTYHDSWEEAKAWLMMIADTEVKQARSALKVAHANYGNIKGLRRKT